MGLESGTYISDLVTSNPLGSDGKNAGDDHIRLIKSTLQATFPSINGAVNATPAQLNKVMDDGVFVPEGTILMWAGAAASVPLGYQLCNGVGTTTSGSSIPIPDLTGRFVVHADADSGGTYNAGDTGGSATALSALTVDGHALTIAEMPAHTHNISDLTTANRGSTSGSALRWQPDLGGFSTTTSNGSGGTHSHTLTGEDANTVPPYLALAYIIKL